MELLLVVLYLGVPVFLYVTAMIRWNKTLSDKYIALERRVMFLEMAGRSDAEQSLPDPPG